jgi:hypothetical protein
VRSRNMFQDPDPSAEGVTIDLNNRPKTSVVSGYRTSVRKPLGVTRPLVR